MCGAIWPMKPRRSLRCLRARRLRRAVDLDAEVTDAQRRRKVVARIRRLEELRRRDRFAIDAHCPPQDAGTDDDVVRDEAVDDEAVVISAAEKGERVRHGRAKGREVGEPGRQRRTGPRGFELEEACDAIGARRAGAGAQLVARVLEDVVIAEAEEVGERGEGRNSQAPRHLEERAGVADQVADMHQVGLELAQNALVDVAQRRLLVGVPDALLAIEVLVDRDDAQAVIGIFFDERALGGLAPKRRRDDDAIMPERGQLLGERKRVRLGPVEMRRKEAMDVEGDLHRGSGASRGQDRLLIELMNTTKPSLTAPIKAGNRRRADNRASARPVQG